MLRVFCFYDQTEGVAAGVAAHTIAEARHLLSLDTDWIATGVDASTVPLHIGLCAGEVLTYLDEGGSVDATAGTNLDARKEQVPDNLYAVGYHLMVDAV